MKGEGPRSSYLSRTCLETICPEAPTITAEEVPERRYQSQQRLKKAWESIFEKYGREFEDADEIDITTGAIVVDKGFIRRSKVKEFGFAFFPAPVKLEDSDTDLVSATDEVEASESGQSSEAAAEPRKRDEPIVEIGLKRETNAISPKRSSMRRCEIIVDEFTSAISMKKADLNPRKPFRSPTPVPSAKSNVRVEIEIEERPWLAPNATEKKYPPHRKLEISKEEYTAQPPRLQRSTHPTSSRAVSKSDTSTLARPGPPQHLARSNGGVRSSTKSSASKAIEHPPALQEPLVSVESTPPICDTKSSSIKRETNYRSFVHTLKHDALSLPEVEIVSVMAAPGAFRRRARSRQSGAGIGRAKGGWDVPPPGPMLELSLGDSMPSSAQITDSPSTSTFICKSEVDDQIGSASAGSNASPSLISTTPCKREEQDDTDTSSAEAKKLSCLLPSPAPSIALSIHRDDQHLGAAISSTKVVKPSTLITRRRSSAQPEERGRRKQTPVLTDTKPPRPSRACKNIDRDAYKFRLASHYSRSAVTRDVGKGDKTDCAKGESQTPDAVHSSTSYRFPDPVSYSEPMGLTQSTDTGHTAPSPRSRKRKLPSHPGASASPRKRVCVATDTKANDPNPAASPFGTIPSTPNRQRSAMPTPPCESDEESAFENMLPASAFPTPRFHLTTRQALLARSATGSSASPKPASTSRSSIETKIIPNRTTALKIPTMRMKTYAQVVLTTIDLTTDEDPLTIC
ncbi:uncharacterized protein EV422DRAFT_512706 [Fimicolochytrium jonesii]|uniref:uncharacterized protein n=1 Tax=Fimicolochytrium jonesii TaxID=1396493 RepID=UPI0022FE9308|nr:uncharacterized protein EV422DRAFT_512706 [Fimicolochytrium jonesii]KAI8827118.1 hypothetical protein EV422DRAFT_512706 [Fimicolochytrium jonesii]